MEGIENEILRAIATEKQQARCCIQHLDSGGLHFSSDVKEVEVHLDSEEANKQTLYLIVKIMPGQEKQIENNSKLGFKKEIAFYKLAVPEYRKIQEKTSLETNCFPNLFGSTESLIILSDLRSLSFSPVKERLDEMHTKLVLQELAKFHATGVALKLLTPELFHSKLDQVMTPALRNAENANRDGINAKLRFEIRHLLESAEGYESFADPVDELLEAIDVQSLPPPQEPYATLLHNDLWWGNLMFKYSLNHEPIQVAFFDFQNTIYNSPAREIVYFLITSVEKSVLANFDSIVLFYHQHFVNCLSTLGIESNDFTFLKLVSEIDLFGPTKIKHMILLFKVLSSTKINNNKSFQEHLKDIVNLFQDRHWL